MFPRGFVVSVLCEHFQLPVSSIQKKDISIGSDVNPQNEANSSISVDSQLNI